MGEKKFTRENKYQSRKQLRPLEVVVKDNDVMQAFKILKHKMSKDGILSELKRRRFAEKPSEARRRKHREAIKKMRKSRGRKARRRKVDGRK